MTLSLSLFLSPAFLLGCGDKDDTGSDLWPENTGDAVATYAEIVEASYADSVTSAEALDGALEALVADPSQSTMDAARQAWLDSREPYLQTEVYRFYDGPIDDPDDGPEGLLNAWPLDENYIDYTVDDATAGVVNDASVTIDAATLEGLNEQGGEANIATGYHAIEFLLWGQDLSDVGPGDRPYTDYVTDGTGSAENQDRRGTYLTVAGDLLLTHLGSVHDQWGASADYRTGFEADAEAGFGNILTGMIILSGFETGGERLQASLDSGDQEDEHSCFSDNTHRDMIQDVQGISNVWNGSYTRIDGSTVSGTSIKSIVEAVNADLASQLDAQIADALSTANALQTPYDLEIAPGSEGNARVQALITSLRATEDLLFEVFDAFGLSVDIPE
jgi:putative iron-regulated protein